MAQQEFEKRILSGSTDGLGILIAATATLGDEIHTADSTALDEIYLYVYNGHTSSVDVSFEWGTASNPRISTIESKKELVLKFPGLLLTNSKVVTCFAATTNVIVVDGYFHRIT